MKQGYSQMIQSIGKNRGKRLASLIMIMLVRAFITTPAAAQDAAQLLAQCRGYTNGAERMEDLATNNEAVEAFTRCIDLGMDPPIKARAKGGRKPNPAGDVGQLPSMECPPFDTCLFGARANRRDEDIFCCPEQTGGGVTGNMPTGYYICQTESRKNRQRVVNPVPNAIVGEFDITTRACNYDDAAYQAPIQCCVIEEGGVARYRCQRWDTLAVVTLTDWPAGADEDNVYNAGNCPW